MIGNDRFFLNLIQKSLKNGGSRVAVIATSIMLGAAVCSAFMNVYLDIDAKVSKELKSYGANLVIVPANGTGYMSQASLDESMQRVGTKIIGYSGYLFTTANIGPTEAIIMGVDFSSLKKTKPFLDIKDGSMITFKNDDRNVLIGVDLAKQAGFSTNEMIDINTPNTNKASKVKIKGIVSSGDKEDGLLITSLDLAQRISNKKGEINYAEAVALGNYDEVSELARLLSTKDISVKVIAKVSKQEGYVLAKIKLLMALVSIVILIITSLCVNTTLSAILLARNKEIALLRALGASKKDVLNLFTTETIILALIFAIIGAFLGYLLAQVIGLAIFGSCIDFRFASIPLATLLALIFAGLAAIYPLKRALKLNMADILRGE